jgi:hypothetical protein
VRRSASPEIAAIQPAKKAVVMLKQQIGRFAVYGFLKAIYRVYVDWKLRKSANRSAHTLAEKLDIVRRRGMSPIRILIEAAWPDADLKKKSRWVRALEYIYSENVSPSEFGKFVRTRGGVAACARLAVQVKRRRRRPRRDSIEGDWDD